MDETPALTEREEIEALLPWYVTGRLDRADRARVDAYLASHPEMRHQLAMIDGDRQVVVQANKRIAVPRTLSASTLSARLPRPMVGIIERFVSPVRDLFMAPTAESVRWAATAVAVAFVAQGVVIGSLGSGGNVGYETASGGSEPASQTATVLVRFAPAVTLEAVGEALGKRDMRIVDGPKPGQIYVIAIGPRELDAQGREKRAAELRAMSGVVALVLSGTGGSTK
jgi:hypothetical protein